MSRTPLAKWACWALPLAFVACLPPADLRSATQRYDDACRRWISRSASELVTSWGAPTTVTRLPSGGAVLQWETVGGQTVPPNEAHELVRMRRTASYWCSTRFSVDEHEVVREFAWNGWDDATHMGCVR